MPESGLILYIRPGCPFSAKVLLEGAVMGLTFDERNIRHAHYEKELLEKGGKRQTPYFIDTERDVAFYESDRIISYLHERFGEA